MIARDGWPLILIGFAASLAAILAASSWPSVILVVIATLVCLLTLLLVYFFRDPERHAQVTPGIILAPADGKVVAVNHGQSHTFVGQDAIQVSIFLSVFDVHVNRVPSSGSVSYVSYVPGKFMAAFVDKASTDNEQTEIGMDTDVGRPLVFKQIAGLIARRIICRLESGQAVQAGQRMGIIKFGSRADILMPRDTDVVVAKGDRVFGGQTVIGHLRKAGKTAAADRQGDRKHV